MTNAGLTRWLQAPPATGGRALICGIAVVALPTIIRAAVSGVVTGCEFTPYLPFVLIAAILLSWWQASAVALVSVAILGGLFVAPVESLMAECFISGATMFLASSATMIGIVVLIRRQFAVTPLRGVDASSGGIIFSLDEDGVWASWRGSGPPLRLGSQNRVEAMMADFLAQGDFARSLNADRIKRSGRGPEE